MRSRRTPTPLTDQRRDREFVTNAHGFSATTRNLNHRYGVLVIRISKQGKMRFV